MLPPREDARRLQVTPADLHGGRNGELDGGLLRPIPGGQLHRHAAVAWAAMREAAERDGIHLEPTHEVDTYRPLAVQSRVFLRRYTIEPQETRRAPVEWNGKTWWLKPDCAPAAVPGTSSHGWGLAVDVRRASERPRAEWLRNHAHEFGWWREFEEEPWHWRYCAGDEAPDAVLASEREKPQGVQVPPDRRWTAAHVLLATRGKWYRPPLATAWETSGLCVWAPAMQPGQMVVARSEASAKGVPLAAIARLGFTPQAIISDAPDDALPPSVPILRVNDSASAIMALGTYARARMSGRLIGVTGSAGKTTTVAMLAHVLAPWGDVGRTAHNANQPYGIAWNLASMPWDAPHAVVEMAIGGMRDNAKLVRPHVAIVTSIAAAHLEYHGDVQEVARRKSRIFDGMQPGHAAVVNRDLPQWQIFADAAARSGLTVIGYGRHEQADVRLLDFEPATRAVTAQAGGRVRRYVIGSPGEHMAMNSLACIAALQALGLPLDVVLPLFSLFRPVPGRGATLDVDFMGKRLRVVDEAYNANPASMAAAIGLVRDVEPPRAGGRKVLVLGDMLELGPESAALHADLARPVRSTAPDLVVLCGSEMENLKSALADLPAVHWTGDVKQLKLVLADLLADGDLVLVKGSGGTQLSQVVSWLQGA
ncbi:Mur ligase family protein [Variovorax boronicumulans]|uniref:Mur ligase family protein n=1 Tax=Variovorax boronicumulans TaxID=436515 RepID=UPI00277EBBA9|nr:Mur ligase family protein [Variovorax boronicumulans]MDQ0041707.1 UDP-N-acetylmuramoyl-tripeptide--D-alanyl-D-alanine ligase [Variovorax boronicumulans]